MDQIESVASFNGWDDAMKIRHVFSSLVGSARTWYGNHESFLMTWEEFRNELLKVFTSVVRKARAELPLESKIQLPNESVIGYVEERKCLFLGAGPDMVKET